MYDHTKPIVDDEKHSGPLTKLLKLFGGLLIVALLVVAGLSIFIRFYLTDDRIKALVIPPAEKALGRTVALGDIDVSLFTGITLNDLAVKEADSSTDFLSVGRFVLHYDLMPLLQKKLVISEITLDHPSCRVSRDAAGHFNFDTLALLTKKPATATKPAPATPKAAALPLALTVERITVNQARITVRDAKGELPAVDATASARVGVDIGKDLASLKFNGDFDLTADATHGELKPQLSGKGTFDNSQAACTMTVTIDQQQLTLAAAAKALTAKPLPPLRLDISSDKLNLDRLLALSKKLPGAAPKTAATGNKTAQPTAKAGKPAPIAAGLPPGLALDGTVKVGEALYQKLVVNDLALAYSLRKGIATVKDLTFRVADGTVSGQTTVDLTKTDPAYQGELKLASVQLQKLLTAFVSPQANILSGGVSSDLKFSGAGLEPDKIKKNLSLAGDYGMHEARLAETPVSRTLATALQMDQLRTMALNNVDGNLTIKEGALHLRSQMIGQDITAKTSGTINIIDGGLNLPLSLQFSGALAEQLRQKASVLKYLSDQEGTTTVNLALAGTTASPKVRMDEKAVKRQIQKKIEQKVLDELDRKLRSKAPADQKGDQTGQQSGEQPAPADPARQLLRGLFGK